MSFLQTESPWIIRETDQMDEVETYQRYWIAVEGIRTERWYFDQIVFEVKIKINILGERRINTFREMRLTL